MTRRAIVCLLSLLVCGSSALAGPGAKGSADPGKARARAGFGPGVDVPFTENFDAYANGSMLAPQGGWEIWYTGGANGIVQNNLSASAPNSLRLQNLTDVVQRFTITDGKWEFKIKTYVPSSAPPGLGGSVIMLNQYAGPDNWSMQIAFNETMFAGSQPLPYMVESQWDGAVRPLLLDQWVELRAVIDLDADTWNSWYGGQPLGVNLSWSNNFFGNPGITSIACLDLWSNGINPMYFDDISLVQIVACYPDCNGDSALNLADFGCFQTKFALADPYADCNGDSVLNLADFGCFQTKFALGCP